MEEACNLIGTWIEPKLIIPALIALISSGVFPFLLHKYKVKREREEKLFDTRKGEYQQYFKVMENAARLAGQEYGEFMAKTLPEASLRLYQENSSPDSVVNYQKVMHEFTKEVQEGFQKATHELVGLRIVCSNKLEQYLDKFEGLYKEILNLQPKMLEDIKESMGVEAFITGDFNFESPTQQEMVALGNELGEVRNQIIKQMRSELGYKS